MLAVCYFMALTWWWIDFTRLSTGHWERFLQKNYQNLLSFISMTMITIYLCFFRDGCGNFLYIDSKWLQNGDYKP